MSTDAGEALSSVYTRFQSPRVPPAPLRLCAAWTFACDPTRGARTVSAQASAVSVRPVTRRSCSLAPIRSRTFYV
eukprot:2515627-Prymnesium_polylepis.1